MRVLIKRPIRAAAAALLTAIALGTPANAVAQAAVQKTPTITIENFGQVSDVYYRGAQPSNEDFAQLAAMGVKTIIDLTDERNKGADARNAGLKFVQIPMSSTTPPSNAQIEEFLKVVNDPVNQPVYVHCKGGRHRTGTLTAVYRITNDGWTADKAFEEMLKYDFDYGFGHGGQKKFVYSYGANLDRTRAAAAATQQ